MECKNEKLWNTIVFCFMVVYVVALAVMYFTGQPL
jgi:hypothetical protein